ncbi:hypothetical protein EMIT0P258_30433 [Pseudomonas sp. IT-P258]
MSRKRLAMRVTTDKNPAGLIERPISLNSPSQKLTNQSFSVTAPALLPVEDESKIPISGQDNSPETPGLEPSQ